jgi:hypothetical protein
MIKREDGLSMSVMVKNHIVTSKYNIINFLPLNIWNQLKKA